MCPLLLCADTPPESAVSLTLKGNRIEKGKVLSLEGDKLVIETAQKKRKTVPITELTATSARKVADRLEKRLAKVKDGQPWIDLAELCLRHAFYDRARKLYRRAGQLDDSFVVRTLSTQGVQESDRLEARDLYQAAVDQHGSKRFDRAKKTLKTLLTRFPSSTYAAASKRLLQTMNKQPVVKKKPDKKVKPKNKKLDPWVRSMNRVVAEIEALRREGLKLQGEGKDSKALKSFRGGMEKIDQLAQMVDRARQLDKKEVSDRAEELGKEVKKLRTAFHLLLGHAYAVTSQMRKATYHVNQVLIDDGENERALKLRDFITSEAINRRKKKKDK